MQNQRVIGLGVFALGLLLFFVLIPSAIDNPGNISHAFLSPEFWPRIVSIIFSTMGLAIMLKPGKAPTDDLDEVKAIAWSTRLPRLAVVLAGLFAFYFLIPQVGMVIPGMAVIFGMMWFAGERRYWLMTVISAIVPVSLYVFFVNVANIPIPLGFFEFIRG